MEVEFRAATVEDASAIVEYYRQIATESDNLSFGEGEYVTTAEQQAEYIKSIENVSNNFMIVGYVGDLLVCHGTMTGATRLRAVHNADLGISVLKQYWGQGIGNKLLQLLIDECRTQGVIRNINLIVRSDNQPAINLYEKFNFKYIGTYTNSTLIDGKYYDTNIMKLDLNA